MPKRKFLRFDRFLKNHLYGENGYYTSIQSEKGKDYLTAPQLSSAYRQFLALYLKKVASTMLPAPHYNLVDLGSGFGELASSLQSAFPGENIIAVEISPFRRLEIRKKVKNRKFRLIPTLNKLKLKNDHPVLIVANEFFDALPVRVFLKENGIYELYLDLTSKKYFFKKVKKNRLSETVRKWLHLLPEPAIFEFEPDLPKIAKKISSFKQAALIVLDYGFHIQEIERLKQGTLTGFSNNLFLEDVFQKLLDGMFFDVTHQVNFTFLEVELKKHGWERLFFESLARFVIKNNDLLNFFSSESERKEILNLILPHRFGDSFKVAFYIKKLLKNTET
jgi:SAM-dependent MidA family methyltransferase